MFLAWVLRVLSDWITELSILYSPHGQWYTIQLAVSKMFCCHSSRWKVLFLANLFPLTLTICIKFVNSNLLFMFVIVGCYSGSTAAALHAGIPQVCFCSHVVFIFSSSCWQILWEVPSKFKGSFGCTYPHCFFDIIVEIYARRFCKMIILWTSEVWFHNNSNWKTNNY